MTDAGYLIAAIGALAAAVGALWLFTQRQTRDLVAVLQDSAKHAREENARLMKEAREDRMRMMEALTQLRAQVCGVDDCDSREEVPVRLSAPRRNTPAPVDPEATIPTPRKPRPR